MASAHRVNKERILFLTDSRGKGLKQELLKTLDINFWVIIRKGSPTSDIVSRAILEIKAYEPSQVYILTGICSITYLNRISLSQVPSAWGSIGSLQGWYATNNKSNQPATSSVQTSHHFCTNHWPRRVDITDYLTSQQNIINDSVRLINSTIIQRNSASNLATPWLQRTIHRNKNKKTTNGYYRLAPDGCHLNQAILETWAKELTVAVKKNSHLY